MSIFNVGKPIIIPTSPKATGLPNLPETAVDYPSRSSVQDERDRRVLNKEQAYARQVMTLLTLRVPQIVGMLDGEDVLMVRAWHLAQWAWEDFEDGALPAPLGRALAMGGFSWLPEDRRTSAFADHQAAERVRYVRLLDLALRTWLGVDEQADLMSALSERMQVTGKARAWWFGEFDVEAPDFA